MNRKVDHREAGNRRASPGCMFNFRVSSRESENPIVVADFEAIPGFEPPRHTHTVEDEVFMIKEGTVTFFVADEIIEAGPGDTIYLPINVPHHFRITSDKVTGTLILVPGKSEDFFRELSIPYEGYDIPEFVPPTKEQVRHFIDVTENYELQCI
ncbi:cupin domain-containing protein [Flavihumibacter solisilvae]|uniref:cupin domain-containing protein n=1 Tax=Flavihumibacter solisilvae TaxID=1349421 RepID=UPI000689469C|nr:cupin domain-containing protein [Flavihumibacter solisilvae]